MIKRLRRLAWQQTSRAFDKWSATYEEDAIRMIGERGYSYRTMAGAVIEHLAVPHPADLLEVGTGPGNLGNEITAALPWATVHGIDISERMLELAIRKEVYRSTARASAERLPFAANRFHGAYTAFVLHSVFDQGRVFSELRRILKPRGRAVIIDLFPVGRSATSSVLRGFFHSVRREFGAPALYRQVEHYAKLAIDHNFEVVDIEALGQPRKYSHFLLTVTKRS